MSLGIRTFSSRVPAAPSLARLQLIGEARRDIADPLGLRVSPKVERYLLRYFDAEAFQPNHFPWVIRQEADR